MPKGLQKTPVQDTTLEELSNGNVKVTHHRSFKLSRKFQSVDHSFGVSIEVSPADVDVAVHLARQKVADLLDNELSVAETLISHMVELSRAE